MKKLFVLFIASGSLFYFLLACTEIRPLSSPKDSNTTPGSTNTCQAQSIEKNIVGTWHFESNFNPSHRVTSGTVTFDAKGNITDPDSLFENRIDLGFVVAKTYKTGIISNYPSYSGELFQVYLKIKSGTGQINPLVVLSNECKKIVMASIGDYSKPDKSKFTLTR